MQLVSAIQCNFEAQMLTKQRAKSQISQHFRTMDLGIYLINLWILFILCFFRFPIFYFKYIQIQFCIYIVHFGHGLLIPAHDCGYPRILIYFGVSQNLLMVVLFTQFYRRAYGQKKEHQKIQWSFKFIYFTSVQKIWNYIRYLYFYSKI